MPALDFEYPRVLWGLWIVLPLLGIFALRSRAEVSKFGLALSFLMRGLWIALCLLALASPVLLRQYVMALPSRVVVLQDMSGSVTSDHDQTADKIAKLRAALGGNTDIAELRFAGKTWRPDEPAGDGNETDIESALDSVSAQNQNVGDLRVVLLSDGRATRGSAEAAAERLALRGGKVYALPIGLAQNNGLKIEHVEPPVDAHVGLPVTMRVTVSSSRPEAICISLKDVHGAMIDRRSFPLQGTKTAVLHLTPPDAGVVTYSVSLEPQDANEKITVKADEARISMHVGSPPRILICDCFPDEMQPLRQALFPLKTPIDLVGPDDWPNDLSPYAAVVISDWSGKELTDPQRAALRQYVEEFGGGLLFIGGGNVMPGQWNASPLAKLLPVKLKDKPKDVIHKKDSLSVVFVIDRSGSMNEALQSANGQAMSKLDLVKAAVEATVATLPEKAQVSVIAFDTKPQEIVPPTDVSNRDQINQLVDGITVGGGTIMQPAIQQGLAAVEKMPGDRYIVVLTDGITEQPASNTAFWGPLPDEARQKHISWTSIAVGPDADQALLSYLAQEARGKFYFCDTGDSVPEVFMQQAKSMKRIAERKERPFQPRAGASADQLKDIRITELPDLNGRVRADVREQVDTILLSENDDPLLATWQFGLGRVSAFTSDAKGGWGKEWIAWKDYGPFWLQQVQAIMRINPVVHSHVKSKMSGSIASFDFAVTDQLGHPVDNMKCSGELTPTKGTEEKPVTIQWRQLGPGEYRASVDVPPSGDAYLAVMNLISHDGKQVSYCAQVSARPLLELSQTGPDMDALASLCSAGNGFCSTDPQEIATDCTQRETRTIWQAMALWPFLLMAALLLWPIDLLVRKLT